MNLETPIQDSQSPPQRCHHCGLPALERFCCPGCAIAFELIQENGLDQYYQLQKQASSKKRASTRVGHNFSYFDHPDIYDRAVQKNQSSAKVTLKLDGIHCSACVWLLEKLPSLHEGIHQARVRFDLAEVNVIFDPKKIELSMIAGLLNQLGYSPRPTFLDESPVAAQSKKWLLARIAIAAFGMGNVMMVSVSQYQGQSTGIETRYQVFFDWLSLGLAIPVVFFSGFPFLKGGWNALRSRIPHMDLPISMAILVTFSAGLGSIAIGQSSHYFDSISMLIFLLLLGRWLQSAVLESTQKRLRDEMNWLPRTARLLDGRLIPASAIRAGDRFLLHSEEVVPVDAKVMRGQSSVDRSILTGEALPLSVSAGDQIYAGSTNHGGSIEIQALVSAGHSRIDQIEADSEQYDRPQVLQLVDRWSGRFTWTVLTLALVNLVIGSFLFSWGEAIDRTVALLVVACPCALGLATPLALANGLASAARQKILIRSEQVFERILRIRHLAFDKTGTLTNGVLKPIAPYHLEDVPAEVLRQTVLLESQIDHPIARLVIEALDECLQANTKISIESKIVPGKGIELGHNGTIWRVGALDFVALGPTDETKFPLNAVFFGVDQKIKGWIRFLDPLRPEAASILHALSANYSMSVLSGDRQETIEVLTKNLPFEQVFGGLDPSQKVQKILRMKQPVMFIGDGVNDALALAQADVGVAIRGGALLSMKRAEVYFAQDSLDRLPVLLHGARQLQRLLIRNIGFALTYNILGVAGAIAGLINPLVAAILMPISSMTVLTSTILSDPFGSKSR